MLHGPSKPNEPQFADRQIQQANQLEADAEITWADGSEGEAIAQQQTNVLLKIAR